MNHADQDIKDTGRQSHVKNCPALVTIMYNLLLIAHILSFGDVKNFRDC